MSETGTRRRFDDAIAGAGILGLAHAYHLAKRGRKVVVFERNARAMGASVRNFGMLWPIGQPPGPRHTLAMRSLEIWREVLRDSGLWHEQTGSLHLAYRPDEAQVLREFAQEAPHTGYDCAFLSPEEVLVRSKAVQSAGLLAGLWSRTEMCVDPREVVAGLPTYLEQRFGVQFVFGSAVQSFESPHLTAGERTWTVERLFVCCGDDLKTLYPDVLAVSGIQLCKLQMLRTQPIQSDWRLGPMLAGGLTLRHYLSFQHCPSLPELKRRVAQETPEYDHYGIHVMASQNGKGEVTLGDSHEYGAEIEPFDKVEIETLILGYLHTFLHLPGLRIAFRWHGFYGKHPDLHAFIAHPAPEVTIITGVGGNGMTLSFGLAEQVVKETLGIS